MLLQIAQTDPFAKLTDYGLAGVVIFALGFISYLFIKNLMTKQEKLEDFVMTELKSMHEKMIQVVENNTSMLDSIKDEQKELRAAVEDLTDKIKGMNPK